MGFIAFLVGVNLFLIGPLVVGAAAEVRGRSSVGWFFLALLFTPIWMLPLVLVLDRKLVRGYEKACPDCAEIVKMAAKTCRHCGYRFPE